MAPEQLEGLTTDARTDVFAFCCVLYEMLSGRKAFEGRSGASLMTAIMAQEPTPLGELVPSVAGRRRADHRREAWRRVLTIGGHPRPISSMS